MVLSQYPANRAAPLRVVALTALEKAEVHVKPPVDREVGGRPGPEVRLADHRGGVALWVCVATAISTALVLVQ